MFDFCKKNSKIPEKYYEIRKLFCCFIMYKEKDNRKVE